MDVRLFVSGLTLELTRGRDRRGRCAVYKARDRIIRRDQLGSKPAAKMQV